MKELEQKIHHILCDWKSKGFYISPFCLVYKIGCLVSSFPEHSLWRYIWKSSCQFMSSSKKLLVLPAKQFFLTCRHHQKIINLGFCVLIGLIDLRGGKHFFVAILKYNEHGYTWTSKNFSSSLVSRFVIFYSKFTSSWTHICELINTGQYA